MLGDSFILLVAEQSRQVGLTLPEDLLVQWDQTRPALTTHMDLTQVARRPPILQVGFGRLFVTSRNPSFIFPSELHHEFSHGQSFNSRQQSG